MRLAAVFLCDTATVRQGLLYVLGGGVTTLGRAQFPAPKSVKLVLMPEYSSEEASHPHKLHVVVRSIDSEPSDVLARIEGGWDVIEFEHPELPLYVPLVIPLDGVALPRPGLYSAYVELDGAEAASVEFLVSKIDEAMLESESP